jgi:peptide/nickel transport system substrate-binding protein
MKAKILLLLLLALSACAPQTPPPAPLATSTVDLPIAIPIPSPTLDPNLPVSGGTLVIGTTQDAESVFPGLIGEGLVMSNAAGSYAPMLAAAMPVFSSDGLTVMYKLRERIKFSDGSDFTCQNVQFTLDQILAAPADTVKTGYDRLASVDCPDPHTAVLTFKQLYAPYLELFGEILSDGKVGTGPWMLQEQGDAELTLVKNPFYRETGKPYLDRLTIKLSLDHEDALKALANGELDLLWNIPEADLAALAQMETVTTVSVPTGENELLVLNFADPEKDAPADAAKSPHPALSDLRVRQAIQFGIDKQKIVATLLTQQVGVGTSVLPAGEFACPQPASPFDPAKATALLEEAGWAIGADGIREKEGKRLSLRITSTSGDALRENVEKMLVTMMKDIGIELATENVPADVLFADWEKEGLRKHGNFDLLLYTSGLAGSLDPDGQLYANYASASIPTDKNGGAGSNFSRYANADVDIWLDTAARSTDLAQRWELYCKVAAQINQDLPRIFLYERQFIAAYRNHLQNYTVSPGMTVYTQGSQNWWLRP